MCGICGIIGKTTGREKRVKSMLRAMRHRGPDDFGILDEKDLTVGMVRLSILDLSSFGHQPMTNREKNIWLVYNGEMYNFQEEKAILQNKGYKFRSTSDTEVVLLMYEEYGDDFVKRLRGMFALAIVDLREGPKKERVLLARDHLGIKPLLYSFTKNVLIFSSEIKALLKSGLVKKEIDSEALRLLLTFGSVIQPKTIIKNVYMLMPGNRMVFQNGKAKTERFWQMGLDRYKIRKCSYKSQIKFVREALKKSVKEQMVSDAPIGAFLSGGIDSSLLVALMSKLSGVKTKTFSVGFLAESKNIDETDDAKKIAKFLKTDHLKVVVTPKDVRNNILDIAAALDQPTVDGVNSYFVSKAARQKVTVAISGTGGDELFAGYPWFGNMVNWQNSHQNNFSNHILGRIFKRLKNDFLKFYARQYLIFGLDSSFMLSEAHRGFARIGREPASDLKYADEIANGTPIERVSALCLRSYTQNQLLRDIDAASMSQSLEVRVPFLDPDLLDIVLSLPDKAKLANPKNVNSFTEEKNYREIGAKKILIDIGKDILPADLDLQKKRGFTLPFDSYLKNSLKDVLKDSLSKKTVKKRGFFKPQEVDKYYHQYLNGQGGWPRVWLLMMTELWAREVLDK